MPFARYARRGLLMVSILSTGACGIIDPCVIGEDLTMDGRWQLIQINGNTIPSAGFPIPLSTDRLKQGDMNFKTLLVLSSCEEDDFAETEGRAVAVYTLVNASGQTLPTKEYAGSFLYVHSTGTLLLKAFGKSASGNRFGDEFTVSGAVPLLGNATLTFKRIPGS